MKLTNLVQVLLLTTLVSSCMSSCAKRNSQESQTENSSEDMKKASFEMVRKDLYKKLEEYAKKEKLTGELWVFYSASGWGPGYGQFEAIDHGVGKITVNFDYKGVKGSFKMDPVSFADFKRRAKFWESLPHINPQIFDSYKYNYFHLKSSFGKLTEVYKLFANAPDLEGKDSPYMEIVTRFQDLIPADKVDK